MRAMRTNQHQESEKGVALLIAIFALMLISAVAISLVLMSDTGTAIDNNYKNSTKAFYSSYAGLEEVRGRLAPGRTDSILPLLPNPLTVSPNVQVQYILNPAPGEVITPQTPGTKYADTEFAQEWAGGGAAATESVLPPLYSNYAPNDVVQTIAGLNGPNWKWVRITGLTEQESGTDVGDDNQADWQTPNPIYEIGGNRLVGSLFNLAQPQFANAQPVYRLTSLSVLPDGSRRMLQYDVVMNQNILQFPSALTMPGPIGSFNPPNSTGYCMDGNDTSQATSVTNASGKSCSFTPPPAVPGCNTTTASLPAIGVSPGNDNTGTQTNTTYVDTQIPRPSNYVGTGSTSTTPSVNTPPLPTNLSSPQQLQMTLSLLQQNANVCLGCSGSGGNSYTFSSIDTAQGSLWTSCGTNCGTTPQITYVNGNMDISGSTTGSGILVVTGNLTYDGNSSWNGIILVVGNGLTTYIQNGGGNGQFNGAIFVANTDGNPPGTYGPSDFTINGGGGNGIYYNSCWISNAQNTLKKFTVLSFREILNF